MNLIYVHEYEIKNNRVTYNWVDREDGPFKKNSFYFEYEGIDLSKMPEEVMWGIFMSSFIPAIKKCYGECAVVFSKPVGGRMIDRWLTYYQAKNIFCYPLKTQPAPSRSPSKNFNHGILYGGGKDSLFTLNAAKNIFSDSKIVLLSYVFPVDDRMIEKMEARRNKYMLEPVLQKFENVQAQVIRTNLRANVKADYINAFHLGLYAGSMLPACIEHDLSYATFSYEYTHFWTQLEGSEEKTPFFSASRPEFTEFLSQLQSDAISRDFRFYNFNYPISEYFAFNAIINTYSDSMDCVTMCEATTNPAQKYCMACTKCAEFAFYNLSNLRIPKDFDLNLFFLESKYIERMLSRIRAGDIKWNAQLTFILHFRSFLHVLGKIDLSFAERILSTPAFKNLSEICKAYRGHDYADVACVHLPLVQALSPPRQAEYILELMRSGPSMNEDKLKLYYGNLPVIIDSNYRSKIKKIKNAGDLKILTSAICSDFSRNSDFIKDGQNWEVTGTTGKTSSDANPSSICFWINETAPTKGSVCSLKVRSNIGPTGGNVRFKIESFFQDSQYRGRIFYKLHVDDILLATADAAEWKGAEEYCAYIPAGAEGVLTISIEAEKNCEPWNWGWATRLLFSNIRMEKIVHPKKDAYITTTRPNTSLLSSAMHG